MANPRKILEKYNLSPNHLLGQNFLVDENILKKLIEAADLKKEDIVLEVGPGLGILTFELAKRAKKVIAVEKDKRLAEILENIARENKIENLEIIQGDILKIFPSATSTSSSVIPAPRPSVALREGGKAEIQVDSKFTGLDSRFRGNDKYKIVANIPYYLTSHLIRTFLESESKPQTMILMIQKEVAERLCAKPPKMSLLAASAQFYAQPKIASSVSKKSFWPSPKVDSAIIEIKPKKEIPGEPEKFFKVLKAGFLAPRKQLAGNLERGLKKSKQEILDVLQSLNIDPKRRAETLEVEEWVEIGNRLN
ncbi:MAG: Ribosomal RNA small subunit methyltransferase A [Parcubacteria group bacterium GW2011_GWC1_43_12]|nr:MAG: Ribosomal RNA small subunit methyltransferase A [Parcubacteria group bacterium GW2011_GWC1_43_12]